MMSRSVDLVHWILFLVSSATFWCAVYAQSNMADGPSNASPIKCTPRRYWWTSMWGFIITLVVLTMDVWGITKATDKSTTGNVVGALFLSTLNPLFILWPMVIIAIQGMAILPNLREALGDDFVAPLYPWSKFHIKLILSCKVVVNLSPDVYEEVHNLDAFLDEIDVKEFSEALVIGPRAEDFEQFNVQLTSKGLLALLKSKMLPPYDELKFLQGHSSLGIAIASAQAIGYIYRIVVRCVQGLRVSPIEAIACVLNMVILMKGVLHNFASLSHRPLLLYLLPTQEAKFLEECKSTKCIYFSIGGRIQLAVSIACGLVLAMGAYFIVNFLKSLIRTCVVSIIVFEVSLVLGGIQGFVLYYNSSSYFHTFCTILIALLNLVGYVWALVVTFKYWKGEDFDVQSSNYLSQVLPYIG